MARRSFAKPQMTQKANRLAFTMWLASCTDKALETASPESVARSYGLPVDHVSSEITKRRTMLKIGAA